MQPSLRAACGVGARMQQHHHHQRMLPRSCRSLKSRPCQLNEIIQPASRMHSLEKVGSQSQEILRSLGCTPRPNSATAARNKDARLKQYDRPQRAPGTPVAAHRYSPCYKWRRSTARAVPGIPGCAWWIIIMRGPRNWGRRQCNPAIG